MNHPSYSINTGSVEQDVYKAIDESIGNGGGIVSLDRWTDGDAGPFLYDVAEFEPSYVNEDEGGPGLVYSGTEERDGVDLRWRVFVWCEAES